MTANVIKTLEQKQHAQATVTHCLLFPDLQHLLRHRGTMCTVIPVTFKRSLLLKHFQM